MADVMWSAPDPPDPDPGTTRRPRSTGVGPIAAMLIALGLVAALSVVAIVGSDQRRTVDERFVVVVRDEHPGLSSGALADDELVVLGRRSCGPDGLSSADRTLLRRLGVGLDAFARDAEALCPQR